MDSHPNGLIGGAGAFSGSIDSEKNITSIEWDVLIAGISPAVGSKVGTRVGRSVAYNNFKFRGRAALKTLRNQSSMNIYGG